MLNNVQRKLARLKGLRDPGLIAQWRWAELGSLALTLGMRIVRGLLLRPFLKHASGMILCEKHVRIYHGRHIVAGRALSLEEGCEIVGLSKRGIVFGDRCTVGRHAVIRPTNVLVDEPGEGLRMGNHSNVGAFAYVGCSGYVDIGNNVLMGPRVSLIAENHAFDRTDIPIKHQGVWRRPIRIEDDCWLGADSTVLAGVTIGHGAVVAAGAVVTDDVPPCSVVAGVPARVIRTRGAASPS